MDEHYYAKPEWFLQNAARYDNYDRNSYKVFAGEYAAQSQFTCSPDKRNTWKCALAEAAFLTGLERNADVVLLASYVPLFAHAEGWQRTQNLIWFDNLKSFGTTNYFVQKMFSNNKGTQVLPMIQENKPLTGQQGLYGPAAFEQTTGEIIPKLVNASDKPHIVSIIPEGSKKLDPNAKGMILRCSDLNMFNTIEQPFMISPTVHDFVVKGKTIHPELAANSFTVIRIKQE